MSGQERRLSTPDMTQSTNSRIYSKKHECGLKIKAEQLDMPSNWSIPKADDIYSHYQIVQLSTSCQEYQNVQNDFLKGLSSTEADNISSLIIKRIENMELWKAFCVEKEALGRKLKRTVNEERLYHGTQVENIEAITRQGFDCRLAGSSLDHPYGKGGYFGKTSDVSLRYCEDGNNMFVVKALAGDYTIGSKGYPRPPLKNIKDISSDLFDSCVDDLASPKMFVLFNNWQVYPEYLITIEYKNSRSQSVSTCCKLPLSEHVLYSHESTYLRQQDCGLKTKAEQLDIPSNWSIPKADDIYSHYQVVQLSINSQEYKTIQNDFLKGLSSAKNKIISSLIIKRIENMELWKAFCVEKEALSRKLKRTVNQERLYHGTQVENIDAIARQGFDFRLAGSRVDHRHGKGGYFGKTSDVSLRYCDAANIMFAVKALVGDHTQGSKEYPRPPLKNLKDISSDLFDSCVDDLASPSMFVLFNNRQVYPEYLITINYKNSRSQFPSKRSRSKPASS